MKLSRSICCSVLNTILTNSGNGVLISEWISEWMYGVRFSYNIFLRVVHFGQIIRKSNSLFFSFFFFFLLDEIYDVLEICFVSIGVSTELLTPTLNTVYIFFGI